MLYTVELGGKGEKVGMRERGLETSRKTSCWFYSLCFSSSILGLYLYRVEHVVGLLNLRCFKICDNFTGLLGSMIDKRVRAIYGKALGSILWGDEFQGRVACPGFDPGDATI